MRHYTKIGFVLTAIWILLAALGTIFLSSSNTIDMSPNEWGDFLAGVFAPLALLWLVIGYFQHGEELRLNTKALRAQQEELRRQVEETAVLAQNSGRQAEAAEKLALLTRTEQERELRREALEAEPEFLAHGSSVSGAEISVGIRNRGGEVRDLQLSYDGPHSLDFSPRAIMESGNIGKLMLRQKKNTALQYPIQFSLHCTDLIGVRHEFQFELRENSVVHENSHDRKRTSG